MKPLDEESRRLIDAANAVEAAPRASEDKVWQALVPQLDRPLPPIAEAASRALGAGSPSGLLGGVALKLIVGGVVGAALSVALVAVQPAPPAARRAPAAASDAHRPSATPAVPSGRSSLLEETQLVSDAQRALSRDDPSEALALAERHRARFPNGALAQERDAARVFALCALQRDELAAARASFLERWPDSAQAARVRAACEAPRQGKPNAFTPPATKGFDQLQP